MEFLSDLILEVYIRICVAVLIWLTSREWACNPSLERRSVILTHVQKDATLQSLFYLETALHVSGDTTTHHQERKQLYLQHLVFVTPLLLPAVIVEELELV